MGYRVGARSFAGVIAAGVVSALVAAGGACSLVENVSGDQCKTDADCTARGFTGAKCVANVCTGETMDPLACLGKVVEPDTDGGPVTLTFPFFDAVNNDPLGGITVRACSKLDLTCANPVTGYVTSNDQGFVSLPLTAGFDGFLEINWAQSYPTLQFINPPVYDSTPRDDTDLVSKGTFNVVAGATIDGGTFNPNDGQIFANVEDCNGGNAAGVRIALDNMGPETHPVYVIDGLPELSATETDSSGNYVAINVPPGPVTLTATVVATGQQLGTATGFIRAGTFSYIFVVPSP